MADSTHEGWVDGRLVERTTRHYDGTGTREASDAAASGSLTLAKLKTAMQAAINATGE